MKFYLLSLSLCFAAVKVEAKSIHEQLQYFNPNWSKHELQSENRAATHFKSDQDYAQAHLVEVLKVLRTNPTDHLNSREYHTRFQLITYLEAYCKNGRFPINHFKQERTPVFIDEHGTHCAVGHLLESAGYDEVAKRIANTENYAWVKDIKDPAIPLLLAESGLSLEEIKLIQGAYDSYLPNAFFLPNRYEIPQKPEVMEVYFDNSEEALWCYGEGEDGVLNGEWIQNYSADFPWIVGFYIDGKRSGQWKEYYQGTNVLCRTENWRNDKLNGVRTRYNMEGDIIEEIVFKDGNAAVKTNYEYDSGLKYIRKPLDSNIVYTEIYDLGGALLAYGNEKIDNPGNLLWFQNIELTALNSFAIQSRDVDHSLRSNARSQISNDPYFSTRGYGSSGFQLYGTPRLVNYLKVGDWTYYSEYPKTELTSRSTTEKKFMTYYAHLGKAIYAAISKYADLEIKDHYDSISVHYDENEIVHFSGNGPKDKLNLFFTHHTPTIYTVFGLFPPISEVKSVGELTLDGKRKGKWYHYSHFGEIARIEEYIIPVQHEEDLKELTSR